MSIHSIINDPSQFLEADHFIVFSEKEMDLRIKQGIPKNKISIIPNGIEVERYRQSGNFFKHDRVNILYVGQFLGFKGIYKVVDIAKQLVNINVKNFRINMVTHVRGEYKNLVDYINSENVSDYVNLYPSSHGERSFKELIDIYASSDMFLLLSEYDCFPTTLLEAMASGLPCVASSVGGIPNIIDHEKTGFHLNPSTSEIEGFNRCRQLISDPGLRVRMGKAGLEKARKHYNIRNNLKKYVEIYEKLKLY